MAVKRLGRIENVTLVEPEKAEPKPERSKAGGASGGAFLLLGAVLCACTWAFVQLRAAGLLAKYWAIIKSLSPFHGPSQQYYTNKGKFLLTHGNYTHWHMFEFERIEHEKAAPLGLFLRKFWCLSILYALAYYYTFRRLQRYMENRPAFELKWSLIAWNWFLAAFSIMGAVRVGEEYLHVLFNEGVRPAICRHMNPHGPLLLYTVLFAFSKCLELGDTLFLVLRKKKVIFLHYYHHMIVMVISFHGVAELGTPQQSFMFMNYTAHAFMYPYYALTSMGFRPPRLVSMTVTTIQIMQMFGGVFVTVYTTYVRDILGETCYQSRFASFLAYLCYISFAVLFVQFFLDVYVRPKQKKRAKKEK